MYRYVVDNAVTYTSEDLVLFRESPFACWMERLTLENPDHGIPPDLGSQPPGDSMARQDELAETLRTEGKKVALIDWEEAEPERRRLTLDAMRKGEDFIVNGQLALGPLSGSANLLMRTSGFSELGNYLYLPCDTQAKTTMHSAFRLCFLADLLHSLQGQMPGQMLIIRGGSDLVPLTTEDHIYHYLAVKQRFMTAMREFRKHRMPDPAESSHFGRWSECANEVIKQRALNAEEAELDSPVDSEQREELPEVLAVAAAGVAEVEVAPQNPIQAKLATARGLEVNDTLAAQARALPPLPPAAESPASTPSGLSRGPAFEPEPAKTDPVEALAPQPAAPQPATPQPATPQPATPQPATPQPATPQPATPRQTNPQPSMGPLVDRAQTRSPSRRAIDTALENLSFIGSDLSGEQDWSLHTERASHPLDSNGPSAREEQPAPVPHRPAPGVDLDEVAPIPTTDEPAQNSSAPEFLSHAADEPLEHASELAEPPGQVVAAEALVDSAPLMDETSDVAVRKVTHPAELAAAELEEMEVDCIDDSDYRLPPGPPLEFDEPQKPPQSEKLPPKDTQPKRFPFSSSLNTSGTDRD